MKINKIMCFTFFIATLAGCEENANNKVTYAQFQNRVADSVSSEAIDCGNVGVGEDQIITNSCVAESYINGLEFYATYQLQGFDSVVGRGISGDGKGAVYIWGYDSDPSGGGGAASRVSQTECVEPRLSGVLDNGYSEIFVCN